MRDYGQQIPRRPSWLTLGAIRAAHRFADGTLNLDDWFRQVPEEHRGRVFEICQAVFASFVGLKSDRETIDVILIRIYEQVQLYWVGIRQVAKPFNFGGYSSWSGGESWRELYEELIRQVMPDTATDFTQLQKVVRERNERISHLVKMAKSVVDAWASDVVDDTMRRAAVLDFTHSKEVEHVDESEPLPIEI